VELLAHLIELIATIWRGDTELRENSLLGQSELDRKTGRFVAFVCGGAILILVIAGVIWWWLVY
jgi:hypothetical protein